MHKTSVIANVFIEWSLKSGSHDTIFMPLNPIALQKIIYIANAMSLFETKNWLVSEFPVIGKYGPVFESLYPVMLQYGVNDIKTKIATETQSLTSNVIPLRRGDFSKYQLDLLNDVCSLYHTYKFDHRRLTNLVGGTDEQWNNLREKAGGENSILEANFIIEHHMRLLNSLNCDDLLIIPPVRETTSARLTG